MWRLLDNTVLSNFAAIKRPDLVLRLWPDQACTTPAVLREYQNAVVFRHYEPDAWVALPALELTDTEQQFACSLPKSLGAGECECIAVAFHRQGAFISDDNHARTIARTKDIELSGTLGVLLACTGMGLVTLNEANRLLKKMITHGYHSPIKDLREL
jgi:predicted nucleic acid-binding protein